MSRPTRGTVATLSANGGSTAPHLVSVTVAASDDRGLLIYVAFRRSTTEDVTAISRDGQTPTLFATEGTHNGTGWATRVYYLNNANSGTADLSVTLSANRNTRIIVLPYTALDLAGTPWGTPTRESDLSTVYGASVTEDQELVSFVGGYDAAAAAGTFTPTGTNQMEVDDNRINDIYAAASYQDETGTVTASWTFGAATLDDQSNWLVTANGVAPAGPTIDTQPVADTGLINGDPARRSTVYTVEATATVGNITDVVWNEDDSPISDGGIYDIQTTGVGTGTVTSVLTITRTVKTGTPFTIDADVTDGGGTTASDQVADTWYTGPVLSKSSGTTNGSGVDTLTITSDYPNADGEFTVVTATAGAVTKQVSLHYEAP